MVHFTLLWYVMVRAVGGNHPSITSIDISTP
jgi:hypothetical protein